MLVTIGSVILTLNNTRWNLFSLQRMLNYFNGSKTHGKRATVRSFSYRYCYWLHRIHPSSLRPRLLLRSDKPRCFRFLLHIQTGFIFAVSWMPIQTMNNAAIVLAPAFPVCFVPALNIFQISQAML
jgi:hypothetical protein